VTRRASSPLVSRRGAVHRRDHAHRSARRLWHALRSRPTGEGRVRSRVHEPHRAGHVRQPATAHGRARTSARRPDLGRALV